jgi:hypothetical protein
VLLDNKKNNRKGVPVFVVDLISIVLVVPEVNITGTVRLGVVLYDRRNLKVFPVYYSSSV